MKIIAELLNNLLQKQINELETNTKEDILDIMLPGKEIEGLVVGKQGSLDIIKVNGKLIRAKSETNLTKGSIVKLRVLDASRPVRVKLLSQTNPKNQVPVSKTYLNLKSTGIKTGQTISDIHNMLESIEKDASQEPPGHPIKKLEEGLKTIKVLVDDLAHDSTPSVTKIKALIHGLNSSTGNDNKLNQLIQKVSNELRQQQKAITPGVKDSIGSEKTTTTHNRPLTTTSAPPDRNVKYSPHKGQKINIPRGKDNIYKADRETLNPKDRPNQSDGMSKSPSQGSQKEHSIPDRYVAEKSDSLSKDKLTQPLNKKEKNYHPEQIKTQSNEPNKPNKPDQTISPRHILTPNTPEEKKSLDIQKQSYTTTDKNNKLLASKGQNSNMKKPAQDQINLKQVKDSSNYHKFYKSVYDSNQATKDSNKNNRLIFNKPADITEQSPPAPDKASAHMTQDRHIDNNPALNLSSALNSLSNHLDVAQQLQNQLNQLGISLLLVPLWFKNGTGAGQMAWWRDEDNENRSQQDTPKQHLFFDLNLQSLGQVKIHIHLDKNKLNLMIWAEDSKLELFRSSLNLLKKNLQDNGLEIHNVDLLGLDWNNPEDTDPVLREILDNRYGYGFHKIT